MHLRSLILAGALVALALTACERRSASASVEPPQPASPPELAMVGAHLLDGLGDHHFEVTSAHPEVQRWFDQGLMLT